ncbi:MAG: REP-associated tyrosine transposase [Gammaproteobacteria bacterium]
MSRAVRVYQPGGTYFFTVVTRWRRPIFDSEATVELLRDAIRRERSRRPFEISAMVVLPDHLHALWVLPEGDADHSSRWREIKKRFTHLFQGAAHTPVWQPRYWDHLIRDENDWRLHMDYIHYNPVKHGYCARAADWRWSSFHTLVRTGWYSEDWGTDVGEDIRRMDLE